MLSVGRGSSRYDMHAGRQIYNLMPPPPSSAHTFSHMPNPYHGKSVVVFLVQGQQIQSCPHAEHLGKHSSAISTAPRLSAWAKEYHEPLCLVLNSNLYSTICLRGGAFPVPGFLELRAN